MYPVRRLTSIGPKGLTWPTFCFLCTRSQAERVALGTPREVICAECAAPNERTTP